LYIEYTILKELWTQQNLIFEILLLKTSKPNQISPNYFPFKKQSVAAQDALENAPTMYSKNAPV
jgi:hypothetical protein